MKLRFLAATTQGYIPGYKIPIKGKFIGKNLHCENVRKPMFGNFDNTCRDWKGCELFLFHAKSLRRVKFFDFEKQIGKHGIGKEWEKVRG